MTKRKRKKKNKQSSYKRMNQANTRREALKILKFNRQKRIKNRFKRIETVYRRMDETKGRGEVKILKGKSKASKRVQTFCERWLDGYRASVTSVKQCEHSRYPGGRRIVNTLHAYPRWSARFRMHLTVCVSQFRINIKRSTISFIRFHGWLSSFFRATDRVWCLGLLIMRIVQGFGWVCWCCKLILLCCIMFYYVVN